MNVVELIRDCEIVHDRNWRCVCACGYATAWLPRKNQAVGAALLHRCAPDAPPRLF